MVGVVPLVDLLIYGIPAFVLGALWGRYSERHKETIRMRRTAFVAGFNHWYDRNIRLLVTIIGALAMVGVITGGAATWANMRQDAERDKLLACFDEYATASSGTSTAVRDASAEVSEAQTARDDRLGEALVGVVTEAGDLDRRVADLVSANAKLVSAQEHLADVRKDNPVPEPPSKFCATQP